MSDPAKSADEIEDVLASIRRLVAESGPVSQRQPEPATPGKLVLTPAQRVAEPDDPWAPVPPAAAGVGAAVAGDATDAMPDRDNDGEGEDPSWGLEDRLSDWGEIEDSAEEAVADAISESGYTGAPPYQVAPERAEDLSEAEDAFDLADFAQLDGLSKGDLPADAYEPETGDANWPDRGADSALRDLAAARFGQVPATGPSEPESTASEPQATAADATAEDDPSSRESELQTRTETTSRPTAVDTPPLPEDAMIDPDGEEPAATPRSRPEFTPVFSRRIDAAPRAEDGGDAAGIEADEIEDLGEAPSPFTFPDAEDGILDEETLREIVAEVVRQELQGVLGQRITRNVRKMVRREIRIALAAEDLE